MMCALLIMFHKGQIFGSNCKKKEKNTQQREHVFCASACLRGAIKVSVTWSQGLPRAQFLNPICDSPRPISISLFLNSTAALVSQWI